MVAWRIQARSVSERPVEPVCLRPPLSKLPWDIAKDEFGVKGADFIGIMGRLLVDAAKDQFRPQVIDSS
jgi:hypothetical protein